MSIDELKKINSKKLNECNNLEEKKIYENIEKILTKDEGIFFKIPMEKALGILKYLFNKEELLTRYNSLINIENFQTLKKNFKI